MIKEQDMRNNNMTRRACFKRLAVFVPVFALAMVFSGCAPEFVDALSNNYTYTETPGTPKNVKAKALSDHSIKISWEPVQGCTNYKVYWSDEAEGDYEILTGDFKHLLHDTVYLDEDVGPEETYYYKVVAYSNGKFFRTSPMSQAAHATALAEGATPIEEVFLDPPTTIYANASSPTSIGLTWTSVANAVGYNVYSSNSENGDYTFRFYHAQYSSPIWNDNECQPGETRYYRIATVSEDGEGDKSAPYSATTQSASSIPDIPTDVSATADGTTITIYWTTVSGAVSYEVYYATSEYGDYYYLGSAVSGTSYTHMDLSTNTTYWYRVAARNGYGESLRSNAASVTTTTSGGSGAAGSSAALAITLYSSYSAWTDGIITTDNPEMWFRAYISDNGTHCLLGWDRYGPSAKYNGDVRFEIYDSGLNLFTNIDAGNGGSFDFPAGTNESNYLKGPLTPGYWYVRVVPYGNHTSNCGTFGIYFY
jgi:fibronectin type 3 domain-containing protein